MVTEIVLISVASAAIAYELTYSSLKRIFFLDKEYPLVQLLASLKAYRKLMGVLAFLFIPVIILAKIHRYVYQLMQCPFCTSFWIGILIAQVFACSWPMCIVIGGLSIFCQSINNFIRIKSI